MASWPRKAFGVIRTAMEKSGQIALGRVVIGTRERILALEPRDKGILAYTIRTDAEVRKPDEIFGAISDKAADPAMISIAEKIIEQQEGPFDPSQFVDRYEQALKALIEDKKKGHKPAKVAEPDDTNVVDLMSALRASLEWQEQGRRQGKTGQSQGSKGRLSFSPRRPLSGKRSGRPPPSTSRLSAPRHRLD